MVGAVRKNSPFCGQTEKNLMKGKSNLSTSKVFISLLKIMETDKPTVGNKFAKPGKSLRNHIKVILCIFQ